MPKTCAVPRCPAVPSTVVYDGLGRPFEVCGACALDLIAKGYHMDTTEPLRG